MPTVTELPPPANTREVPLSEYPVEHRHIGRSVIIAVGFHLLVGALICLVAALLGITTLKELLDKGGAIAESGPAPEEPMTVELQIDEIQPPPTPNPEFIQEIVKPKSSPSPAHCQKPEPPKPNRPTPRYTAPNATGAGRSLAVSQAVVGSSGLPHPSYPVAALNARQEGTVQMQVVFDGSGGVASASVVGSSGVVVLDSWTRDFIVGHWHNVSLANQTIHVPVIYDITKARR